MLSVTPPEGQESYCAIPPQTAPQAKLVKTNSLRIILALLSSEKDDTA